MRTRRDSQLSFQLRRLVPLDVFTGQVAGRQQRLLLKREETRGGKDKGTKERKGSEGLGLQGSTGDGEGEGGGGGKDDMSELDEVDHLLDVGEDSPPTSAPFPRPGVGAAKLPPAVYTSLIQQIDSTTLGDDLYALWRRLQRGDIAGQTLNVYLANKMMSAALKLELPDLAVDIFEDSFGYYYDPDPAKDLIGLLGEEEEWGGERGGKGGKGSGRGGREQGERAGKWAPAAPLDDLVTSDSGGLDVLSLLREGPTDPQGALPPSVVGSLTAQSPLRSGVEVGVGNGLPVGGKGGKVISFQFLEPNNYVCTTAVKAYGRRGEAEKVGGWFCLCILVWVFGACVCACVCACGCVCLWSTFCCLMRCRDTHIAICLISFNTTTAPI